MVERASLFLKSNGIRHHVMDYGGGGEPMIALHATGFGWWQWDAVATELTASHHVYAVDLRGHGGSDKPTDGYSVENFATDLDGLLDALNLDHAVAMGHSVGAKTVIAHASLHPGRLSRALIIEPVINAAGVQRDVSPIAAQALRRRPSFPSRDAMFESFRARSPFATWQPEILRLYCEVGTVLRDNGCYLKCPPELEALTMTASGTFDVWEHLPRIQVPTRFIWGEQRWGIDARDAVLEIVPESDSQTIPGTTHTLVMERPEAVAAAARDFF